MTDAHARRDDPWTSWAAAHSIPDVRSRQAAILHLMHHAGQGLTLEQIVFAYRRAQDDPRIAYPPQTDSSIRSRTSELVDLGHVVDTGEVRITKAGRKARVLAFAPPSTLF